LAAYLACWRVRRAGVAGCLPLCPRAAGADFLAALGDDAALVDWAALGLELGFLVADGDLRGLVVTAEGLLPALRVRTWGAGPAVGVGCTRVSVGCVVSPRSRAIARIILRMASPYR
jgi:hypothetical protein